MRNIAFVQLSAKHTTSLMPFEQREERNKRQELKQKRKSYISGGDLLEKQSRTEQGVKRSWWISRRN